MSELKILGKIDLSKFDKKGKDFIDPEKYVDFLQEELFKMSQGVNEKYGKILDEKGTLIMEGEDSSSHQEIIDIKEGVWAKESGLNVGVWKKKREKNVANLAEISTVILLNKFFGDRFLVARASTYDDYEYGVDNVLLDKKTGAVICGFDQVIGMGQDDGGNKKRDKMEKLLLRGGTKLEYGVVLDDNKKIKREKLDSIPAFFLAITKNDLMLLMEDLKNNKVSVATKKVLNNILDSIDEQYRSAQKLLRENKNDSRYRNLLENLEKFSESFAVIEDRIEKLA